ncbi:hypothetical protein Poli38472_001146 [Pythium oligandrum]|uniref:Swt1-like HEPN domain-containing protein n=1 Tax=Pythium oligandrum TaxID=41045 RepID=A0A8K1CUN3_PYTOL|nr:hypothetical protein Poli38472_001146 [Pythium oligandrum]|eukprot:TMW68990.1 hypothetical protein Poli38472_001146 [Pythium oligandrum]
MDATEAHVAAGCLHAVMSLAHVHLVPFVQQVRREYLQSHRKGGGYYDDTKYEELHMQDLAEQLKFIRNHWKTHFGRSYRKELRSSVYGAIDIRNKLAHQQEVSTDWCRNGIAVFNRLLCQINAPTSALDQVREIVSTMAPGKPKPTKEEKEKMRAVKRAQEGEAALQKAKEYAQSSDFANAVHWTTQAIERTDLTATLATLYALRASYRYQLLNYEDARQDAEQAISCDGLNMEGYRWLSASLMKLKRKKEALSTCLSGLQRRPAYDKLQERLKHLLRADVPVNAAPVDQSAHQTARAKRLQCEEDATIAASKRRVSDAIELMDRALELVTPEDFVSDVASIFVRRAELHFIARAYGKVIEDTSVALKLQDGVLPKASALQCEVFVACTREDAARAVFARAYALSAQAPELVALRGTFLDTTTRTSATPDVETAERAYETAVSHKSRQETATAIEWATKSVLLDLRRALPSSKLCASHLLRAQCHYELGQYTQAISDVERVLGWGESQDEASVLYCESLVRLENWSRAQKMIDSSHPNPSSPNADKLRYWKQLVGAKLGLTVPWRVLAFSTYCMWTREECFEHAKWLGSVGEYLDAIALSSRALDRVRGDEVELRSTIYQHRAFYWLSMKDFQHALEDIDKAVTRTLFIFDSKTAKVYDVRSRALMGLNRAQEGVNELISGLNAYPGDPDLKKYQVELEKRGCVVIAKTWTGGKKFVARLGSNSPCFDDQNPDDMKLTRVECSERATRYVEINELEAAVSWCTRALMLISATDPPDTRSWLHLTRAEYYLKWRKYSHACDDAEKALQLRGNQFAEAYRVRHEASVALRHQEEEALRARERDDALKETTATSTDRECKGDEPAVNAVCEPPQNKQNVSQRPTESAPEPAPTEETFTQRQCAEEAKQAAARGEMVEAIKWTTRSLKFVKPKDPAAVVASVYVRRAEYSVALKAFADALVDTEHALTLRGGRYAKASAVQCQALLGQGEKKGAHKVYVDALERSPASADLLALMHLFPGVNVPQSTPPSASPGKKHDDPNTDQSMSNSNVTIEQRECLDIATIETCIERAVIVMSQVQVFKAIGLIDRALELVTSEDSPSEVALVYIRRAELCFIAREYQKVIDDTNQALDLQGGLLPKASALQCEALVACGRPSEARLVLNIALKLSPSAPELLLLRTLFDDIYLLNRNAPGDDYIEQLYQTAVGHKSREKLDTAIEWATRCIEANLRHLIPAEKLFDSYLLRAQCHFKLGQYMQAISDVERMFGCGASRGEAWVLYCESLARLENWPLTLVMVDRGVEELINRLYASLHDSSVKSPDPSDYQALLVIRRQMEAMGMVEPADALSKKNEDELDDHEDIEYVSESESVVREPSREELNVERISTESVVSQQTKSIDAEETFTQRQCAQEATKAAANGEMAEAIKWVTRSLAFAKPKDPPPLVASIYVRRAEYSVAFKAYADALEDADRALQLRGGRYAKASAVRCQALLGQGKKKLARKEFAEALERSSTSSDLLALVHLFPGVKAPPTIASPSHKSEKTVLPKPQTHESRSTAKPPITKASFKEQAIELISRRNVGNAIPWLNRAVALDGDDLELFVLLAQCRFGLHQYPNALKDVQFVVSQDATNADGHFWMSKILLAVRRYDEALLACIRGSSIAPKHVGLQELRQELKEKLEHVARPSSNQSLADTAASRLSGQDPNGLMELLTVAIAVKRTSGPSTVVSTLYYYRAACFFAGNHFNEALEDADEAINAQDGGYADGYVIKCRVLAKLERNEEALGVCSAALVAIPDSMELQQLRNDILELREQAKEMNAPQRKKERKRLTQEGAQCMSQGDFSAAEDRFSKAIVLLLDGLCYMPTGTSRKASTLYSHRARCRLAREEYELALEDATQAVKYHPSFPEYHRLECSSLMGLQRWEDALAACDRGLQYDPEHKVLQGLRLEIASRPRNIE